MENLYIDRKMLRKFKYDMNYGSESSRFYNDEIMIKLINRNRLVDDRQYIIERLHGFEHENIVPPIQDVYEKRTFVGFTMKYLKDYILFDKYKKLDTTFNQRKEVLLKMASVFDYFDKMNFSFHDIHPRNILYKDGDVKLIDLDGGIFKNFINNDVDYPTSIRASKKNLARFILTSLYQVNESELLELKLKSNYFDYKLLFNILPDNVKEFYDFAFSDNYTIYNGISESLDNIDEQTFEDTIGLIKKRPL